MLNGGLPLPFRIFGIRVYLDWTLLIVLPLFTWTIGNNLAELATQLLGMDFSGNPYAQGGWRYVLALMIVIGLYVSVLVHEFGHALTARAYGVQTSRITLWLLGGVAQFERMPRQPGAEAVVAIVGPLTSFAVAGVLAIMYAALPPQGQAVAMVIAYLSVMNLALAIFNLLPALPLDGGRVLRSVLALKLSYTRATQLSAALSKILAGGLAVLALFGGNFMLVLVAIFIWLAVNAETQQTYIEQVLRDLRVQDLMTPRPVHVRQGDTVDDLLTTMLRERHTGFPVVSDGGEVLGIVSIDELGNVDRATPVEQVMRKDVARVHECAPAVEAFRLMPESVFGRVIAVDDDGQMVGILTKADLVRMMRVRGMRQQAA